MPSWNVFFCGHSLISLNGQLWRKKLRVERFLILYTVHLYPTLHHLYYYTSKKSWRGFIFTSMCVCVFGCVCMCVSETIIQPNGFTDFDEIFAILSKVTDMEVSAFSKCFLYDYCKLSVSLCVCVCVCVCVSVCLSVCLSVNKIPAERMHQFGRDFR